MNNRQVNTAKLFIKIVCIGALSSCNRSIYHKGYIKQQGFVAEIPIVYHKHTIYVKARINDAPVEKYFLLDTGAPTVLFSNPADSTSSKSSSKVQAEDSRGQAVNVNHSGTIQKISIGGIDFKEQGFATIPPFAKAFVDCIDTSGFGGIMGASLLKEAVWDIDVKKQKIVFSDQEDLLPPLPDKFFTLQFKTYPFLYPQESPIISLIINGRKKRYLLFDTGYNGTLELKRSFLSKLPSLASRRKQIAYQQTSTVNGSVTDTIMTYATEVLLGNLSLRDVSTDFSTNGANIAGLELFESFRIRINWKSKRIYLIPYTDHEVPAFSKRFGFATEIKEGKVMVVTVIKDSDAAKAGVSIGDQLVEVNGTKLLDLNKESSCAIIRNGLIGKDTRTAFIRFKRGSFLSGEIKVERIYY